MKTFRFNKNIQVVCESQSRRSGFRHVAVLMKRYHEFDRTKICYINRTWERYTYESVLMKLISDTDKLTDKEKRRFINKIKGSDFGGL